MFIFNLYFILLKIKRLVFIVEKHSDYRRMR